MQPIILDTAYTSKDLPIRDVPGPCDEEEETEWSVMVLIDVDGRRKYFRVGYYNYSTKEWRYFDYFLTGEGIKKVDLKNMRWFYIPQYINFEKLTK